MDSRVTLPDRATSARGYRARQAALDKIVREDMPRNRREIQEAKEFGDLSENFEYESARNRERELIARQSRLQSELRDMTVFDFAAMPPPDGVAGPGSRVTLRYGDGTVRVISILGDWDADEALGIVSRRAPLAQAVEGRRAGETCVVQLPDPDFDGEFVEESITIDAVDPLSEEVRAWSR